MKTPVVVVLLACGTLDAQDIAGKWTGTADTVDASGVKRMMQQTIEIKGSGKELSGRLLSRSGGAGIPLRVVQEGSKVTLLGDIDFEGGEHLRWYFEMKYERLVGKVWALHDSPKKWGVDWTGPVEMTRAAPAAQPQLDQAVIDRWMQELSNWGRWGKTDQRGTVNLITPERVQAAAALVKEGYSVS
jgi:hypothetical protein